MGCPCLQPDRCDLLAASWASSESGRTPLQHVSRAADVVGASFFLFWLLYIYICTKNSSKNNKMILTTAVITSMLIIVYTYNMSSFPQTVYCRRSKFAQKNCRGSREITSSCLPSQSAPVSLLVAWEPDTGGAGGLGKSPALVAHHNLLLSAFL